MSPLLGGHTQCVWTLMSGWAWSNVDVQVAYAVTAHMCMWLTTIRVASLLRGDM